MNYRATYAHNQSFGKIPVFSNAFTVTDRIHAAGSKAQLKTFKELWDKDPSGVARALADVQKDMKFAAAFNARILKLNRDDIYHKRIMNKGEKWIKTKGLREFNASMAITTANVSSSKNKIDIGRKINTTVKQKYFNELSKRGYNAVVDLNDVKYYGSEEPLLIFKGSKTLKRSGKAIQLTVKDMDKARYAYMSSRKLKKYQDTLHI